MADPDPARLQRRALSWVRAPMGLLKPLGARPGLADLALGPAEMTCLESAIRLLQDGEPGPRTST